ncbi:MAG: hypothetical protein JKX94_10850 [Sneathiella sp.]|nr:hypothetical protein [Sneathiella sp.]
MSYPPNITFIIILCKGKLVSEFLEGMEMATLGTLAWMAKSQGKLALRDQMALIFQGVRAKAAMARRLKVRHKARYCEVKEKILVPLQREATERPCCRMAFLQNKLDLQRLILKAPFAE